MKMGSTQGHQHIGSQGENSLRTIQLKDTTLDSEPDKSTDPPNKHSDHFDDYSLHHEVSSGLSEIFFSKMEGSQPIQCTDDQLEKDFEIECSTPEAESSQQSDVTVCDDDVDLMYDAPTQPSECAHDNFYKKPQLKVVFDTTSEKFVVKEELRLKYKSDESTDRKLSPKEHDEVTESEPLDLSLYLKPPRRYQHHTSVCVYMLHGFTAKPPGPDVVKQSLENGSIMTQYNTEMSRLGTYIDYPTDVPIFAITLAKDGFVYLSSEQSVVCCFCLLHINLRELRTPGAEPVKVHGEKSPYCPLKKGERCGNVPVPKVGEISALSNVQSQPISSGMTTTNDSHGHGEERPADSGHHRPQASMQPSSVHRCATSDIATDQAPAPEEEHAPPLPPRSSINGNLQPSRNAQRQSQQQPSLPTNTSPPRVTVPPLQRSDSAAAAENRNESRSRDSRNRSTTSNSTSSSGKNASEQDGASSWGGVSLQVRESPQNGAPSASASSQPSGGKHTKSKKSKAAKKAEARKLSSNSGASASSSAPSVHKPPSSNTASASASSDKVDQTKEKKKLTYADLGIFADKPKRPDMASLQKRLVTYEGKWKSSYAKTAMELAECGMYYAGYSDCARCFFCGGGLKNWEVPDEPWVEHARWFPKCAYISLCKGPLFVEIVQRKNERSEKITLKDVEEEIKQKTRSNNGSAESLPALAPRSQQRNQQNRQRSVAGLAELEAENEELKSEVTCKICMDERSSVVFLPCGHMVACTNCAVVLKSCPLCRADIRGTVKAHLEF